MGNTTGRPRLTRATRAALTDIMWEFDPVALGEDTRLDSPDEYETFVSEVFFRLAAGHTDNDIAGRVGDTFLMDWGTSVPREELLLIVARMREVSGEVGKSDG